MTERSNISVASSVEHAMELDDGGDRLYNTISDTDSNESQPISRSARRHDFLKTLAGVVGNAFEWYDFAIFGFFSDVIADVFFPKQEGSAALIESFAIFGGAFFMRPVGGVAMGYIGDKYGRKKALEISIFLMAFPTFFMGCLPSYAQVGLVSPILLLVVRLLQGLSVGGQLMSSLVFTLEGHPRGRWGYYGAVVMASAVSGTSLGSFVGTFTRAMLTDDELHAWGWRLPFLSGIFVSFSGVYLKYYCKDDEIHVHAPPGMPENPIQLAFSKGNRRSLISASLVPVVWAGGTYLWFVWMAVFMNDLIDPPIPHAYGVNAASYLLSVALMLPVAGHMSDKINRQNMMISGAVSTAILSPLMIALIGKGDSIMAFCAQCVMGVCLCLWGGPMCAWLVESFPPAARLTSVSIGYNIAQAFFGGSIPALATFMVQRYGKESPGYLLTFLAVLSLIGLKIAPPMPIPNDVSVVLPEGDEEEKSSGDTNPEQEAFIDEPKID